MFNPTFQKPANPSAQRGAALFVALILLMAITLVSLASLSTSLLELRMSNNTEAGVSAFEYAQSAMDDVISNGSTNFLVTGVNGETNCTASYPTACTYNNVVLPSPFDNAAANQLKITRTSDSGCPPRIPNYETSCDKSKAASFTVDSLYDRSALGQGKAQVLQGYVKVFPTPQGDVTGTTTGTSN